MKRFRKYLFVLLASVFILANSPFAITLVNADYVYHNANTTTATYKTKRSNDKYGLETSTGQTMVWIAPKSGTKYHYLNHSQHFDNSSSKKIVTLDWAIKNSYTLDNKKIMQRSKRDLLRCIIFYFSLKSDFKNVIIIEINANATISTKNTIRDEIIGLL